MRTASPLAIVGAGPAGLTAAIAARRLGLDVAVFERASSFRRVGGGLLFHSNGQRVLDALGILEDARSRLLLCWEIGVELPNGRRLSTADYRTLDVPYNLAAVFLRADLQEYLLGAARDLGVDVRFGHDCLAVDLLDGGARLRFEGGAEHLAAVVIGADGLGSAVRASLGLASSPRAVGEAYLRGVAPVHLQSDAMREIWGPDGRRFGLAPLPNHQTYFFCSVPIGEWAVIRRERLRDWLDGWRGYGADVRRVLAAVPSWEDVNYDELREIVLDRWHRPPVFLVGDAAHAMTPNLGQGANSALVDALVLVRLLAPLLRDTAVADAHAASATPDLPAEPTTMTDAPAALTRASQRPAGSPAPESRPESTHSARRLPDLAELDAVGREYERVRKPFVTRVQTTSRQIGWLASLRARPARLARDLLVTTLDCVPALRRRALLLGAGYNLADESYFARLAP
ncbi:MAG: FAD-dependent monooxygenase [Chloroflexi bacterium]|nr:FAD-dependent monooxygenase [Chloroflexota bacterium]